MRLIDKALCLFSNIFAVLNSKAVPGEFKDVFDSETLYWNIRNEKIIAYLLVFINAVLLLLDVFLHSKYWMSFPAYKSMMYVHIFALVLIPVFLFLCSRKSIKSNTTVLRYAHHGFTICAILGFTVSALCLQVIRGHIYNYIIGMFIIASLIILPFNESITIFSFSFAILFFGLILIRPSAEASIISLGSSALAFVFTCFLSRVNFINYTNSFIAKNIILKKTIELDKLNKNLDSLVRERTCELKNANERLILEIKSRHELELESLKSRFQYEEKERELKEAVEISKLKSSIFTNLTHEFRTPLSVLLTTEKMIEFTLDKMDKTEQANQLLRYAGIMKQNCFRLHRLISNFIDMSKLDSGHYGLKLTNYDIVKLVEDITLSIVKYAEIKHIDLVFDTEEEELFIACDPDKIERIVLNLLSNAFKFTPEYGSILVHIYQEENKVNISVKDTGPGIPREFQSSVFKRFFQTDNSLSRLNEGSGIGLSLVKALVELHNGTIQFTSDPGKGSEFIVSLPIFTIEEGLKGSDMDVIKRNQKLEKIDIEFSDIYF